MGKLETSNFRTAPVRDMFELVTGWGKLNVEQEKALEALKETLTCRETNNKDAAATLADMSITKFFARTTDPRAKIIYGMTALAFGNPQTVGKAIRKLTDITAAPDFDPEERVFISEQAAKRSYQISAESAKRHQRNAL